MNNLLRLIVLSMVALLLTACPDSGKKKSRISPYRGMRYDYNGQNPLNNPNNPGFQSTFQAQWGEVVSHQSQLDGHQQAVWRFASASADPTHSIGTVSGVSGDTTGIRIAGGIQMNGAQVTGGMLYILIYDSKILSGEENQPYTSESRLVNSQQTANGYTLTFQETDQQGRVLGTITMEGSFTQNGGMFEGMISFVNARYWDGATPGAQDYLGYFIIPTCGFFQGCT